MLTQLARTHALLVAFVAAHGVAAALIEDTQCVIPNTGPAHITADCIDPTYNAVTVDSETDEINPVTHHKITAHFDNSTTVINIYLPPKGQWENRFFHYVYPTAQPDAANDTIGFAIDSKAYLIQITGTIGYRADAAAAKFSRTVAAQYYGTSSHIYGYLFGGSGGSYQTIGAIENTEGIWDGALAFIQGVPESNPPDFSVRALAGLVMEEKATQIIDAVSPGGSLDAISGLSALQRSVLTEATFMGVPFLSWEDFERVGGTWSIRALNSSYRLVDPAYKDDFWSLPGYEGTEHSELGDIFRAALVNFTTTIEQVIRRKSSSPTTIVLHDLPIISNPLGLDFTVYNTEGIELGIVWGNLDVEARMVSLYEASNVTAVSALEVGQTVGIDNRLFLALHCYHRHQLPSQSGFYSFDQFRDEAGNPLYPQRDIILAEHFSESTSGGGTHTGNISSKLVVVDNLMDSDAYPWHAIWYRARVESALGAEANEKYRLWFNDHANHEYDLPVPEQQQSQLVPYRGMIQYSLRELAAWVEDGVLPADNTNYTLTETQVSVADTAAARHGIQPVATLSVNGGVKPFASVGDTITFKAHIEVPDGTSKIVALEWDFIGRGNLVSYPLESPVASLDVELETHYNNSGTFLPAIRVTSQREGDASSAFARAMNLGRARVVIN